jgi:type IV pilus assembly protein PilW
MKTIKNGLPSYARAQRGYTLVELMVTVGIALFLLGGLITIVQNIRQASLNQQALVQLLDEQRFAMTVLTDLIQTAGYYPTPVGATESTMLPASGANIQAGQALWGTHPAGAPDSLTVRYAITGQAGGGGQINCDGSTNNAPGVTTVYTNQFTVVPAAGNVPGQLRCSLNGAAPVALVNGIQNLVVYYGVNRNAPGANYTVDTYLTADQMNAALPGGGDWMNVSSVRIVLTFANPLFGQAGQNATVQFERVAAVMARTGPHS